MSVYQVISSVMLVGLIYSGSDSARAQDTQHVPEIVDTGAAPAECGSQLSIVAIVLGEPLLSTDADAVQSEILTRLFEDYADTRGLAATEQEIAAFLDELHTGKRELGLSDEDELSPAEAAEVAEMERGMARTMVERWKINRSLYEQYGGRIIFQQFGLEPLDAYSNYLEEQLEAGSFVFCEDATSEQFWRYFRDESIHSFVAPDSEEAKDAFSIAPWKREP